MEIMLTPPPDFVGSNSKEINSLGSYLYKMHEELNYVVNNLTFENFTKSVQENMASAAENGAVSLPDLDASLGQQYEALKSIIVKTSDNVYAEIERVVMQIQNEYVAESEFGDFKQETENTIKATSQYVDNIYNLYQELTSDIERAEVEFNGFKLNTSQYIRTGLLFYEEIEGVRIPRYGVAIGENLTEVTIDGVPVMERKNIYTTVTSDKLSFWQGTTEVAYISSGKLYISDAYIKGSLNFNNQWKLDTIDGFAIRRIGGLS